MRLRQLWETRNSLIKLLQSDDLGIALAWRLRPLVFQLKELEKTHLELFRKYGQQTNGTAIEVPADKFAVFSIEFEALMNEELPIVIRPICVAELDGAKLSAIDLANLDYLIVENELQTQVVQQETANNKELAAVKK